MHHYKSLTPKRHIAYSNSAVIKNLDRGILTGWKAKSKEPGRVKTVEFYQNKKGKTCWKGTKRLKQTETLGLEPLLYFLNDHSFIPIDACLHLRG